MNTVTNINLSKLRRCNQYWDDMPEIEKGRLCLKCQNTIIDFRNMTKAEIAQSHLFSENKVCGLYTKKQLQKPTPEAKNQKSNKWTSIYIGLFSFLTINAFGQESEEPTKTEQTEKEFQPNSIERIKGTKNQPIVKDSIFIRGVLTDENDMPLPFVNVIIKNTKIGTTSDFDGNYRLNITEQLDSIGTLTLKYVYVGYETEERIINHQFVENIENRTINVRLREGEIIEFVVYHKPPLHKRIWYRIKNVFRK
jgi:hypothetical protein